MWYELQARTSGGPMSLGMGFLLFLRIGKGVVNDFSEEMLSISLKINKKRSVRFVYEKSEK
jgi:hypothetical protein